MIQLQHDTAPERMDGSLELVPPQPVAECGFFSGKVTVSLRAQPKDRLKCEP